MDPLRLRDGRRLGIAEYGARDGEPILYFHGHPGSRLEAQLADDAAKQAGLWVIALDRPGYGRSDFQPGRTILDWPGDVAEAADRLDIGKFAVIGASGGGPYALACGHELPERIRAVGVLSGVGPYQARGVTRGMRWQNRVGFQLGSRWPALARLIMRSMARNIQRRPEATIDALAQAMSPVDAAIVRRPEVRRMLRDDITEAFRHGSDGAAWDVVLLGRPWGFALEDITPVVYLWQGEADVLVPPAMGRHMAAHLPHCRARTFPGEGHLLAVDHLAELVETLSVSGG